MAAEAETRIQVIHGLGNPGAKYAATRHNAGFWFLDELARRHAGIFKRENKFDAAVARVQIDGLPLWLVKPETYMNHCGRSLRAFNQFYRLALPATLVVHDEIDLPAGRVRLKRGGGHGGHNGLRDIFAHLGQDFLRLRLGVGHPGEQAKVIGYVLDRPSQAEALAIQDNITQAAEVLPLLLAGDLERAMNRLHTT